MWSPPCHFGFEPGLYRVVAAVCTQHQRKTDLEDNHEIRVCRNVSDRIHFMTNDFEKSAEFDEWLKALKARTGKARILHRLTAAEHGNFGDCEPVGGGVSEMRIHCGPGYRVYFTRIGKRVYFLLVGGDKSSQKRDIKRAVEMAQTIGRNDRDAV